MPAVGAGDQCPRETGAWPWGRGRLEAALGSGKGLCPFDFGGSVDDTLIKGTPGAETDIEGASGKFIVGTEGAD